MARYIETLILYLIDTLPKFTRVDYEKTSSPAIVFYL